VHCTGVGVAPMSEAKRQKHVKVGRVARPRDEDLSEWKALVPLLYDWFAHHHLVWPSLSCRYAHRLPHAPTLTALSLPPPLLSLCWYAPPPRLALPLLPVWPQAAPRTRHHFPLPATTTALSLPPPLFSPDGMHHHLVHKLAHAFTSGKRQACHLLALRRLAPPFPLLAVQVGHSSGGQKAQAHSEALPVRAGQTKPRPVPLTFQGESECVTGHADSRTQSTP